MKSRKISARIAKFLQAAATQVEAYEKREQSRAEQEYGFAMQRSAAVVMEFIRDAPFEELIEAEQTFQKNDLLVYAKRPAAVESVQDGIDDINTGMKVYNQLLKNTVGYIAHKYRKRECLPPENIIPKDAMRHALRGQVKRVENYRANVMGNIREQEFMSARIAMLHRAEQLYDTLQREKLLPPEEQEEQKEE